MGKRKTGNSTRLKRLCARAPPLTTMSYYFAIVGTQDAPLFEYEFGTSKQGHDGLSRFPDQVRHLNQFILHSSLDIAEEVQWAHGAMYLKCIDKFFDNYISCFVTGANVKFLLLHHPLNNTGGSGSRSSTAIGANPTSPRQRRPSSSSSKRSTKTGSRQS